MGTVDGTVGFGFKIDKWEYDFTSRPEYDAEKHPDLWNYLDDQITAKFNLLDHDVERFGFDIYGHGAIFLRSTMVTWYGVETNNIEKLQEHTPEGLEQLKKAAEFLGLPYETGYLLVTSFG